MSVRRHPDGSGSDLKAAAYLSGRAAIRMRGALRVLFDAFASREPVSTSLETPSMRIVRENLRRLAHGRGPSTDQFVSEPGC
jgi:hypothetical protein